VHVVTAGPSMDFINALTKGSTENQDMSLVDAIPPKIKDKIPKDVQNALAAFSPAKIKQMLPKLKDALAKCVYMTAKDCIKELKKVDPALANLINTIKPHLKNLKMKIISKLQEIIPKLQSQLLKNILQTAINMLSPPMSRRRKRSTDILVRAKRDFQISIKIQIKSLMKSPMTLSQVIMLIKQIGATIKMKLSGGSPSILQQIVNLLGSLSPIMKAILSNPDVMKLLGTSPPSK